MKVNQAVLDALKGSIEACDSTEALDALVGSFADEIKTGLQEAIDAKRAALAMADLRVADAGLAEIVEARPEIIDHVLAAFGAQTRDGGEGSQCDKDCTPETCECKKEAQDAVAAKEQLEANLQAANDRIAELEQKVTELEAGDGSESDDGKDAVPAVDVDAIRATLVDAAEHLGIEVAEDTTVEALAASISDTVSKLPSTSSKRAGKGRGKITDRAHTLLFSIEDYANTTPAPGLDDEER